MISFSILGILACAACGIGLRFHLLKADRLIYGKLGLLLLAVVALASCSDDNKDVTATKMMLNVNGESYEIALPATEEVNLITLCTEFDAEIEIDNADQFQKITVGGIDASKGSCSLPITKLSADNHIVINYKTGGKEGSITVNTLHPKMPAIVSAGKAMIPGDFYLSFIWRRFILKYDNDGNLLFYRYGPMDKDNDQMDGYWDFKKHNFDGKTYYSFHAPDDAFGDRAFTGYDPGMRVLLDDHYRIVKTIHAKASRDGYVHDGDPIDGHDFYFFTPDHYILSAYVVRNIDGVDKAVSYLQEVDNGEVVFDWWSSEHPEMADWASPVFDTSFDSVHFNCLRVLPDGNLLCSFRVLSSVVKIDRAGGTGNILWRIDGESLPEEQRFYGQHYVTYYDDGTLSLFDNGNGHEPKATRLLLLNVDQATGAVTGGGNKLPGNTYFTFACGALQFFDDWFTAGWGWCQTQGSNDRLVSEYNAQGQEMFALRHNSVDSQVNQVNASYRCVKCQ